ncbi:hypothetical protein KJ877_07555 [bacterium]|nr:hypothetical protein [bacterium]MBU1989635.1 hypothetical protein [bacterium]
MSISSIGSSQTYQASAGNSVRSAGLTSEQKTLIEETLSQYDAGAISSDDAAAIVKAFQEAGIEPSSALAEAMSASGFDAKKVGDLAGAGQAGGGKPMGGPPPPPSIDELSTITDLLESLLEESEDDETTTTNVSTTSSPYNDDSMFSSFNTLLDYTNQIVNLKDDAKNEVMNILDAYAQNESQNDIQKSVVNSLNEILSKPQNYNRISFYA